MRTGKKSFRCLIASCRFSSSAYIEHLPVGQKFLAVQADVHHTYFPLSTVLPCSGIGDSTPSNLPPRSPLHQLLLGPTNLPHLITTVVAADLRWSTSRFDKKIQNSWSLIVLCIVNARGLQTPLVRGTYNISSDHIWVLCHRYLSVNRVDDKSIFGTSLS